MNAENKVLPATWLVVATGAIGENVGLAPIARVEGPDAAEAAKKIARVLNDVLDGQTAVYNMEADFRIPKRRVRAKRNKEMRKAQIRAQRKFIDINKKENRQ